MRPVAVWLRWSQSLSEPRRLQRQGPDQRVLELVHGHGPVLSGSFALPLPLGVFCEAVGRGAQNTVIVTKDPAEVDRGA
jgi:hypothetical protein